MKKIVLLAAFGALFAQNAKAVDVQPYVGADYVYSWADVKENQYFKDRFQAYNLSAGVMATSVIGLELFYQQSEQNKKSSDLGQTKIEYKGYGLDGVYYLALLDRLQGVGSLGLGYYEVKAKVKALGGFRHGDDSHFGLRVGAGVQYNIDENLAARLMLRYHHIGADELRHITDLTAGVRYYF